MSDARLKISPALAKALHHHQPVVALESAIISHGMPFPCNVETALQAEQVIHENGATPATIAILNGCLHVGLNEEQIRYLGAANTYVIKVSRRDIPFVVAAHKDGATTVAGTMILAAMAGIKLLSTGGVGGVHRGGENTLDISADLQELAITNVAVVCAGVKSILDLGLTREYLETLGVPIVGYKTNCLPAFFNPVSPYSVDYRLDSPKGIAAVLQAKWAMGLAGGVVVTNPIPEQYAMALNYITTAMELALAESVKQGVTGKAM